MSATVITANLVTAAQMNNWAAQHLKGRIMCTADEWCYIMNNEFTAAKGSCASLDNTTLRCCGYNGSNRATMPQITSDAFLSCLLNTQTAAANQNQGPGGGPATTTTTPTPAGGGSTATGGGVQPTQPAPVGQGVLGLTNCSICQQISSNPLLLVLLAVGVWYFFFDDK